MPLRLAPAIGLAATVTLALFWIMTVLIRVPDLVIVEPALPVVTLVEVERELEPPPPPPRKIARPKIEPAPAAPSPLDPAQTRTGLVVPSTTNEGGETFDPIARVGSAAADGDALPIVRVPPVYPTRALARGVEGRVLVEFDVDSAGAVADARVIVAEPPQIFDRAAVEAVQQWRYSPKVVRGRPVERRGLRIAIPFVLDAN